MEGLPQSESTRLPLYPFRTVRRLASGSVGSIVRTAVAVLAAALVLCAPAGAATHAKGLDVSHWQGPIDWLQVAGAGNTFVFAKATEGTTITDVTYAINRAGAQGVGMELGAYHFARPGGSTDAARTANAIAQADHFVDVAQTTGGDLPLVLDLETKGGLTQTALLTWTRAWLDEVSARTGVRALVYTSPNFWKTAAADSPTIAGAGSKLWVAHWTTNSAPLVPGSNWGGTGWTFWQWTDCTKVPGIAHCVDGDRVNGASPAPFVIPALAQGVPAPVTQPAVVGTAQSGIQLAAVPGAWSGGKPVAFTYQWSTCDAAGAGCVALPGATLETYKPTSADVGHALAVTVTATTSAGTATASSRATLAVRAGGAPGTTPPAVISPPAVTGTPQVGQILTGAVGTWSGSPTSFAYEWRRCDAAGAGCTTIVGQTTSSYTLTPDDIGATLSLIVTATGKGGSQATVAPTTPAIAAAPTPAPLVGSVVAQTGVAGAVITSDGRATVSWQPGVVTTGTAVGFDVADTPLAIAGTGVTLTLTPTEATLRWPLDIAYPAAPAGQVVGFSADGTVFAPVPTLTTRTLPSTLGQGSYLDGSVLHVLTREPGRVAIFQRGRWGDPSRISPRAPIVRRLTPIAVTRQRDRTVLLVTRLSTSSQAHLYASLVEGHTSILKRGSRFALPLGTGTTRTAQVLVLSPGGFPVKLRLSGNKLVRGSLVRLRVTAVDPYGRRGVFTLSFKAP
jgi:GH25 family lysozyme M1 (1,4-beta-N-acetylmuramidase)